MIRIVFKYPGKQNLIWSTDSYFDNTYKDEWFQDPLVQKIVKEIDRCTYFCQNLFQLSNGKYIVAERLSGGTKCLILALKGNLGDIAQRLGYLGDNCFKYLAEFPSDVEPLFWGTTIPIFEGGKVKYQLLDYDIVVDNVVDFIRNMPDSDYIRGDVENDFT